MEFQLDKDWRLQPIKGATGQTYMGIKETEKVFIKRNTSPLLAALSKEGLAPKMIWTKRTANGDVLTAQEWLEGRLLHADEISKRNDVIDVLYQLHHSNLLKDMLKKIGGEVCTPLTMLKEYKRQLPKELKRNSYLKEVITYLYNHLPEYPETSYVAVHGDVNHRNWLVSNNYLYLVDWDSVMVADPAVDLGMILSHYVPRSGWNQWLLSYGLIPNESTVQRIYWYGLFSFLQEIVRHHQEGERRAMTAEILQLKRMFSS